MNRWSLALADWPAALGQRRGWRWLWMLAALLLLAGASLGSWTGRAQEGLAQ